MDELLTSIDPSKCIKTYSKLVRNKRADTNLNSEISDTETLPENDEKIEEIEHPLSTKNAVKFLLEGNLDKKVCRYCLNITPVLIELDQLLTVGSKAGLYSVTIKDMIASFHPFKIENNPNYPNKICNNCLDRTISCYLFSQQCDQSERALTNCFEDVFEKFNKLDPLDRTGKRGRHKLKTNHNILNLEHENVIDYAEPVMNIVSTIENDPYSTEIVPFECLKCATVLPNLVSLINHTKIHPKTMHYNCRICGKSFPKLYQLKRHLKYLHVKDNKVKKVDFQCKKCGDVFDNYHEFLQHTEKYKFKQLLKYLFTNKMDKLCAVCYDKGKMMSLNEVIVLHGGTPELTGEYTLFSLLKSIMPEVHEFTGTKLCEHCYNNIISTYLYTKNIKFIRNRLQSFVESMVDKLNIEPETNICIEVSQTCVMPDLINKDILIDEITDKAVDVLEDEFRIESDSESDIDFNSQDNIVSLDKDIGNLENRVDIKNGLLNEERNINNKRKNNKSLKKINNNISNNNINKINQNNIKKTKLTCYICKKYFVSDYYLKRHVLKHVNAKTCCDTCQIQFNSKFELYEHNKYVHLLRVSKYYMCVTCCRSFISEYKLQKHAVKHNNKCVLCNKYFKSQFFLNIHMKKHYNKINKLKSKYIKNCCFCEKQCNNDNELTIHINKVHLKMKFNCNMCEKQFYSEINLKYHKRVHYNKCIECCMFCDKIFNCRKRLVTHIKKHIDTPLF